jgi:hypothetical protein
MIEQPKQGFSGKPKTEWQDDDRSMILLEDFSYTAISGVTTTAVKGTRIDGKSTPRFLWGGYISGSPYVGHCRRGSIIHDKFCEDAERIIREMNGGKLSFKDAWSVRRFGDKLYREMAEYCGAPPVKRAGQFVGVTIGSAAFATRYWFGRAKETVGSRQ